MVWPTEGIQQIHVIIALLTLFYVNMSKHDRSIHKNEKELWLSLLGNGFAPFMFVWDSHALILITSQFKEIGFLVLTAQIKAKDYTWWLASALDSYPEM